MKQKISDILNNAVCRLRKERALSSSVSLDIAVESPNNPFWGDYSSNIAIKLAKEESKPPLEIARLLSEKITSLDEREKLFKKVDVAPPGFVNFFLDHGVLQKELSRAINLGEKWGSSGWGRGKKVLIEFVSANPTGPLHVGHGRWAVIGDALASILTSAGCSVEREFYVNDVGRQVELLKGSVLARSRGEEVPEGGYGGEYVKELANELKDKLKKKDLTRVLIEHVLKGQRLVLSSLGIRFDRWYYESSLYKKKMVYSAIDRLKRENVTFEEGGALWFKSKELGDDKNRVLIREDGLPTYFASDIAYHMDKFKRRYDQLINVWGTDHHGYVARLKAAIKVLGFDPERLKIIIGQLVSLSRAGQPVRMSKRTGEMITLEEVVSETGSDATRFFFLMQSPDTHLDFDLELAKKHSNDNPVYYVQYAHARISSILSEAGKAGFDIRKCLKGADLGLLREEPELELIKKIISYPDEVLEAAKTLLPHRLINYVRDLSALFHNYYHRFRVISGEGEVSKARLSLIFATRIVLKNVLKLLNISAPDSM